MKTVLVICAVIYALYGQGSFSGSTGVIHEANPDSFADQWIADLDFLAGKLPKKHKNLFFQLPESEFKNDIEILKKKVINLENYEIIVGIMKILSKVGDSHTTAGIWRIKSFHYVPVGISLFSDGFFVTRAERGRSDLIGDELIRIKSTEISEVVRRLEEVISHENQAQVDKQVTWLMINAEVLKALGIAESINQINS